MEYVQVSVDEDSENSSSNNSRSSTSHGARASLGGNLSDGGKSADNTGHNSDEEGVSMRSQREERKRRRSRQAEEEATFAGETQVSEHDCFSVGLNHAFFILCSFLLVPCLCAVIMHRIIVSYL